LPLQLEDPKASGLAVRASKVAIRGHAMHTGRGAVELLR